MTGFAARMLAVTAMLAAGGLAVGACAGARGRGEDYGVCRQSIAWGGWDGTPQCAGIASTVIAAEDRACESDEDCALVATTNCSAHAVNRNAFARYASMPAPCTHPLSGMCAPRQFRPVCDRGCCVPASGATPSMR